MRTPSFSGPPAPPPTPQSGYALPSAAQLVRQAPGVMAPPPRLPQVPYTMPTGHRAVTAGGFDESLRLPPLRTQVPHSPTQSDSGSIPGTAGLGINHHGLGDSQARSIEAMVKTIPYRNKFRVLCKISPPLAPPGPGSPAVETRGPVIAIEGADAALVKAVGAVVEKVLVGSGECAVRVWGDGAVASASSASSLADDDADADAEGEPDGGDANNKNRWSVSTHGAGRGNGSGSGTSTGNGNGNGVRSSQHSPFGAYLATIMEWHAKSDAIVKHVTTVPAAGGFQRTQSRVTPVALITGGFSCTLADRFAVSIPIVDSYAPIDHWQWMATMWRGIVGPDLVVYVRSAGAAAGAAAGAGSGAGAGGAAAPPVPSNGGTVGLELPWVMVVRVDDDKGALDEKTERRLAFEVVEWVRAASFRQGFVRP